ncbi:MAG: tetratricopeptide repeat protein [Rhodospirillales bacterium]|nr:tetratricopeptide repeat protein [Rhodospirillales bacterium]
MRRYRHLMIAAALAAGMAFAGPVSAFDTAPPAASPAKNWRLTDAQKAVKAKNYAQAIALLDRHVADNTRDADAYNYLGYSHRKLGNRDKALAYYTRALDLDPDHRGANEYLGELYLDMNDLPKAEERLGKLAKLCGPGCEEYRDLAEQVAKFKAGKPRS